MTDSWSITGKTGKTATFLKKFFVSICDAGFVAGTPQETYLVSLGMPSHRIFKGYDVVDNDFFSQKAGEVLNQSKFDSLRDIKLPNRYFLSLGRFVKKKNLTSIIQAYAKIPTDRSIVPASLVFVGEGPDEKVLRQLATDLKLPIRDGNSNPITGKEVVFYPFQQIDKTPTFFARAEVLILPSLWEEWGLVVNEAMACGTPTIVSDKVGSAQDLVINGETGYQFEASSIEQLISKMQLFAADPQLSVRLGRNAQAHIDAWGLDLFAKNAVKAIKAAHEG